MNVAAAALVLAPALALGSFLNVVVARVPARRSLLRPPSSCGSCSQEILWRDNNPVLSYLLLKGRCRHCEAPIPIFYPLVEFVAAALIVACVAVFGPTSEAALAAGFCAVLVTLSAIDVQLRIVPNRIVVPAAAVALVVHTAIAPSAEWLLAALAAAGFLFAVVLVYPKGLGMGDVKLALLLGAVLGASVSVALMLGLFAALVPAVVLVSRHGTDARKMGVPLVPFLALGAVVTLFLGEWILDAYLGLF
ncbi:MAG: prepilin peptidase [Thermoleophilia bacterium]|nr:prepilin peptidase [Thermoleophilia bacterium]